LVRAASAVQAVSCVKIAHGIAVSSYLHTTRGIMGGLSNPSAEWYRCAVQSIRGYAMFTTDINGRIVTWDRGAVDLFGYRKEDVLGEDASLIFLPEDITKHAPEQEIAQAMENRVAPDERWHVRKDGSLFWANGLMMVMTDEAGRQIGFVKIVREGVPPARE
jgi:two-component system, chemotaxis family, CheB/CheR fusion protein